MWWMKLDLGGFKCLCGPAHSTIRTLILNSKHPMAKNLTGRGGTLSEKTPNTDTRQKIIATKSTPAVRGSQAKNQLHSALVQDANMVFSNGRVGNLFISDEVNLPWLPHRSESKRKPTPPCVRHGLGGARFMSVLLPAYLVSVTSC